MSDEHSFSGFTDSDLKKHNAESLKNEKSIKKECDNSYTIKPSTLLKLSAASAKRKERRLQRNNQNAQNTANSLTQGQRLSTECRTLKNIDSDEEEEILKKAEAKKKADEKWEAFNNPKSTRKKGPTIDDFEERQKLIEEENRRRRSLLTEALADRKKKTSAEQRKLLEIQEHLNKLDELLSYDVAILRDHIDQAAAEYDEAQKHYEKVETEFVNVKLNLFKKMERKQQLTEYLCTIIEQNELRKSKMLDELMSQLNIDVSSEFKLNTDSIPVLPQMCSLNEITYTSCTTLKDPAQKKATSKSKIYQLSSEDKPDTVKPHIDNDVESTTGNKENETKDCDNKLNADQSCVANHVDNINTNDNKHHGVKVDGDQVENKQQMMNA